MVELRRKYSHRILWRCVNGIYWKKVVVDHTPSSDNFRDNRHPESSDKWDVGPHIRGRCLHQRRRCNIISGWHKERNCLREVEDDRIRSHNRCVYHSHSSSFALRCSKKEYGPIYPRITINSGWSKLNVTWFLKYLKRHCCEAKPVRIWVYSSWKEEGGVYALVCNKSLWKVKSQLGNCCLFRGSGSTHLRWRIGDWLWFYQMA